MIVEQVWTGNAYRNFNYLIACPETGDALAIDPLDFQKVPRRRDRTAAGRSHRSSIRTSTAITPAATRAWSRRPARRSLRTRTPAAASRTWTAVSAPATSSGSARTVELECLDTPGHTMCHICLLSHTDQPALFSGDTLFNAGAGNCHNGGHPEELYDTFDESAREARATIRSSIRVTTTWSTTCALRWTVSPTTSRATQMLREYEHQDPDDALVTTLAQEREMNTFFRLDSPSVIARLREDFPEIGDDAVDRARCS